MAILLKTTLVRVSSIQIMQVRVQNKGKSVWKSRYDGDVLVSCTLLGESQVGGEVVDAVAHCLLFLMQSSLCTKEVAVCDVGGHVVILLYEEWVGRSTWHIHHSKQNM